MGLYFPSPTRHSFSPRRFTSSSTLPFDGRLCTKKACNHHGYRLSYGSGRRIRTLTYGVRVRCATFTQSRYVVSQQHDLLYSIFRKCQYLFSKNSNFSHTANGTFLTTHQKSKLYHALPQQSTLAFTAASHCTPQAPAFPFASCKRREASACAGPPREILFAFSVQNDLFQLYATGRKRARCTAKEIRWF